MIKYIPKEKKGSEREREGERERELIIVMTT